MNPDYPSEIDLLRYCWPKKPIRIIAIITANLFAIIFFIACLRNHQYYYSPHGVLLGASFVLLALCEPFGQLAIITQTLRVLRSPSSTATLTKFVILVGIVWSTACIWYLLMTDFHGVTSVIALTGMLVMIYVQEYSSPSTALSHISTPLIYLLSHEKGLLVIAFLPFISIITLLHLRPIYASWKNFSIGQTAPINGNFNDAANSVNFVSRPTNLNLELGRKPWPNFLRHFGIVKLRTYSKFVILVILLSAATAFISRTGPAPFIWLILIFLVASFALLIHLEHQFLAMYACKKERAFLITVPGLPSLEDQSRGVRIEFWRRLSIFHAVLLTAAVIVIIVTMQPRILHFFLTVCAAVLFGARMIEIRIANYADSGKLTAGAGALTLLAIVIGVFVGGLGYVYELGGLFFLLSAALCILAWTLTRNNLLGLELVKRE